MAIASATTAANSPTTFPNIAIGASAGTGKTFQLSNRYLALINAGEPPEQVLAVTFTRKAAGEILDRILTRLAEAASSEAKWRDLHGHIGGPILDRSRCIHLLRTLLQSLQRLRISTLDSFFIQIASALALELGLPTGWQIVDEIDDQRLRAEAMRDLLSEDDLEELVTLIRSLSQQEASRSVIDVLASIATNLYHLAQQTQRDAWHALTRLPHLEDDALADVIQQIAAFEFKDKRFAKANLDSVASAQAQDWGRFITKGLAAPILAGHNTYFKKPIEVHMVGVYQQLIDHARALLLDQVANQSEATRRVLDRFGEAYERLKRQRRTLRFDDVTRAIPRVLTDDRFDDIAYRLDAPVAHLLLDQGEPHDTALRQAAERMATVTLDVEVEIQKFRRMINMPQTHRVLSRDGYADLAALGFSKDCLADLQHTQVQVIRERPFAIRDENALVYGIIDRLVLFRQNDRVLAADIVDFKSDALTVDQATTMHRVIEIYRPQLALYCQAVSRQFGLDLDCIRTRLLFLQLGEICHIEACYLRHNRRIMWIGSSLPPARDVPRSNTPTPDRRTVPCSWSGFWQVHRHFRTNGH